jgi:hypothetical protein
MTETKTSSVSATPRTFRRTMVGDVLYSPLDQQYDRRRYGDAAVDAVILKNGSQEELTEFQALLAMGQTHQALQLVVEVAEQIKPQVMAEARRDARSIGSRNKEQARAALVSGHVSAPNVSPWVYAVQQKNSFLFRGLLDKKGEFHKALCRYFSHLPFKEEDLPTW